MRKILLLFLGLSVFTSTADAIVLVGVDGAMVTKRRHTMVRSHTYMLFGNEMISMGPFALVDSKGEHTNELIWGGAIKFGHEVFLQIGTGVYKAEYEFPLSDTHGDGRGSVVAMGVQMDSGFRFVAMMIVKAPPELRDRVLEDPYYVEAMPLLGFNLGI